MQKRYGRINPNTLIAQEALEPELWTTTPVPLPNKPLVLSWHGLGDNLQYVEPLIERLGAISNLRLRIIMPELDSKRLSNRERVDRWPVPVDFVVWQRETFAQEIATAHGGIVVLPDTEFCRCKASHKALSYAALGMPCIASDMPGYREVIKHGVTGLLADTDDDWRECIKQLRDADVRSRMGEEARDLSGYFTKTAVCDTWDRIMRGICKEKGLEVPSG